MFTIGIIMKIKTVFSRALFFVIFFLIFNTPFAISTDSIKEAPVDYVKENTVPVLFSAILEEDVELYSKEMKFLLNQPIKEFNQTILFKTDRGDTIFHLMAGVRSYQDFFVKEMQNLKDIFSQDRSARISHLALGGVMISIPNIEDTELGQAIKNKDASDFISIANHLEDASAIEWLKSFHARTKGGQSLKGFISEHFDMSPLAHLWNQTLEAMENHPEISSLFLMKNNKGLLPKDIAYKSDNFFAYTFISKDMENSGYNSRDNLGKFGFGAGAILGVGLSLGWGSVPYSLDIGQLVLFKTLEAGAYGYLGAVASGFSTKKCRDVFEKMKVNTLRKRSDRNRRQP